MEIPAHDPQSCNCLRPHPDGTSVLSGGDDGWVKVWTFEADPFNLVQDEARSREMREMDGDSPKFFALDVDPND
eukprot:SAG31_NODE_47034_length_252_cov_0.568627_1_plen_73_part_01